MTDGNTESRRVFRRWFLVMESHQEESNRFKLTLLIGLEDGPAYIEKPVDVTVSTEQKLNYRKLQAAVLEQTGHLIYDERLEKDGVSKWPRYLAEQLGKGPRKW